MLLIQCKIYSHSFHCHYYPAYIPIKKGIAQTRHLQRVQAEFNLPFSSTVKIQKQVDHTIDTGKRGTYLSKQHNMVKKDTNIQHFHVLKEW